MAEETFSIDIEGRSYTPDELTFAEQRQLRAKVRELMGDPKAALEDASVMDFVPVLVWIIMRRQDPEFPFEKADGMKLSDFEPEQDAETGPTKPAAAKRAAKK